MIASEWQYLSERKMRLIVLVAIALIPAIYCFIYLSSMWNTYGRMDRLPVAIVNHDRSRSYQGEQLHIGKDLTHQLIKSKSLDFHQTASKTAFNQLRQGKYYMVLTIPKDFSGKATTLLGKRPQQMKLRVTFNSGQNFIASKMTTGAAAAIKSKVAAQITTLYTQIILTVLANTHTGMKAAASGSKAVDQGTQKLVAGQSALVAGTQKIHFGIGQLMAENQRLGDSLSRAQTGIGQLVKGTTAVKDGLDRLSARNQLLASKLSQSANQLARIHTKSANASALANPVHEVTKDIAKVPNNGTGMAPFAIAIGLYVGAIALGTMYDGFLPRRRPKRAISWWASKSSVIGAVSLLQTMLLVYSLTDGNHLKIERPIMFFTTLLLGSGLFLSLIFCLRLLLGGFGTWLVSIILVLQLAASGGLYPTYLTNSFASSLNKWLPMTYLINALRSLISTHQEITGDLVVILALIVGLNVLMILRFQIGLHQSVIGIGTDLQPVASPKDNRPLASERR
jgi:putative membrane protein